jgi:hypothetical protein
MTCPVSMVIVGNKSDLRGNRRQVRRAPWTTNALPRMRSWLWLLRSWSCLLRSWLCLLPLRPPPPLRWSHRRGRRDAPPQVPSEAELRAEITSRYYSPHAEPRHSVEYVECSAQTNVGLESVMLTSLNRIRMLPSRSRIRTAVRCELRCGLRRALRCASVRCDVRGGACVLRAFGRGLFCL